jgi:hypothetical protein
MAQHCGDAVWEDGAYLLEEHPVKSWEELRDRILRGIAEINAAPVVHRWRKFGVLDEVIF